MATCDCPNSCDSSDVYEVD